MRVIKIEEADIPDIISTLQHCAEMCNDWRIQSQEEGDSEGTEWHKSHVDTLTLLLNSLNEGDTK